MLWNIFSYISAAFSFNFHAAVSLVIVISTDVKKVVYEICKSLLFAFNLQYFRVAAGSERWNRFKPKLVYKSKILFNIKIFKDIKLTHIERPLQGGKPSSFIRTEEELVSALQADLDPSFGPGLVINPERFFTYQPIRAQKHDDSEQSQEEELEHRKFLPNSAAARSRKRRVLEFPSCWDPNQMFWCSSYWGNGGGDGSSL